MRLRRCKGDAFLCVTLTPSDVAKPQQRTALIGAQLRIRPDVTASQLGVDETTLTRAENARQTLLRLKGQTQAFKGVGAERASTLLNNRNLLSMLVDRTQRVDKVDIEL